MRPLVGIGLSIALALLGAACGNSSASNPPASASPSYDPSLRWREFGLTDAEFNQYVEKVQTLIASCMQDAGFEYLPADVETIENAQAAVRTEPGYTREEYEHTWGYGITTRFDDTVKQIELGEENLAYIAGLPEADRVAYERTLYGNKAEISADGEKMTFARAFDDEDWEDIGGCTKKAVFATFTAEQLSPDFVNPKDVIVENDPRVVAAVKEWHDCMEEAGFEGYWDQDEIMEELRDRFDEVVGDDDPRHVTGKKAKQLKALQEWEVRASSADLACEIAYTDEVYRTVEIEVFGRPVSG